MTDPSSPPVIARLLLFNREGDCREVKLRPGNVHSAEGWEELLLAEIECQALSRPLEGIRVAGPGPAKHP